MNMKAITTMNIPITIIMTTIMSIITIIMTMIMTMIMTIITASFLPALPAAAAANTAPRRN